MRGSIFYCRTCNKMYITTSMSEFRNFMHTGKSKCCKSTIKLLFNNTANIDILPKIREFLTERKIINVSLLTSSQLLKLREVIKELKIDDKQCFEKQWEEIEKIIRGEL